MLTDSLHKVLDEKEQKRKKQKAVDADALMEQMISTKVAHSISCISNDAKRIALKEQKALGKVAVIHGTCMISSYNGDDSFYIDDKTPLGTYHSKRYNALITIKRTTDEWNTDITRTCLETEKFCNCEFREIKILGFIKTGTYEWCCRLTDIGKIYIEALREAAMKEGVEIIGIHPYTKTIYYPINSTSYPDHLTSSLSGFDVWEHYCNDIDIYNSKLKQKHDLNYNPHWDYKIFFNCEYQIQL